MYRFCSVPGSVLSMHFSRFCANCTCELILATHSPLESEKLPSHPQNRPVPYTPDTPHFSLTHSGSGVASLQAMPRQAPHQTLNQASISLILHGPCQVRYPVPLAKSNLALTCSKKAPVPSKLPTYVKRGIPSPPLQILPVLRCEVQNSSKQTAPGQRPVPTPRDLSTPARAGPGTRHPLTRPGRGAAASLRTPRGGGEAPPGSAGAARGSCSGLGPATAAPPSRRGRQRSGGPRRARSPSTSASACSSSRARRQAQPGPRARQRGQPGPAASAARWAQPRHSEWPQGRAAASPEVSRHPAQPDSSGRGGSGGCSNGGGSTSSAGPEAGPGVPVLAAAISSQRPRRPRRLRAAAAAAEEARVLGPAAAILFPV